MPEATVAPRSGPGRPSSGADERILQAALEVLEQDGYTGLTTAKVATRSGHNKALIAYHFGSKQGLVAEVSRRVGEQFSRELLAEVGQPGTAAELARELVDATWNYIDRHGGQARIYFDIAAQAIVDAELKQIVDHFKESHRALLTELMAELEDGPPEHQREPAVLYMLAALEGLALERIDRGHDHVVQAAADMFVRSAQAAFS